MFSRVIIQIGLSAKQPDDNVNKNDGLVIFKTLVFDATPSNTQGRMSATVAAIAGATIAVLEWHVLGVHAEEARDQCRR